MTPMNPDIDRPSSGRQADGAGEGSGEEKFQESAHDAKREAGDKARDKAEAGQHRVADEADALSDAIDAAAENLDDHDRESLARYARELSSNLATAAGQLEGRSVDELAKDAKRLARDNPALFMLGSIGVGFGLSRFFKASAERNHDDSADQRDEAFKEDEVSTGVPLHGQNRDMSDTNTTPTAPGNGHGRDML